MKQSYLSVVNMKSRVVNLDEKETGVRAILNFGHTLGHAIENCLGYQKILHGEAIAIGMLFAAKNFHAFIRLFPLMNLNL